MGPITRDAQTDTSTIESRFETSDTTQDEADAKLTLEERLQKIRSVVNARSTATALHDAITDVGDDEPMDQEVTDDATPRDAAPLDDFVDTIVLRPAHAEDEDADLADT